MSRSSWWDEEKIQQLISLCCQYSIAAHAKGNYLAAADILFNTGKCIEFIAIYLNSAALSRPSISDRWLDVKLTNILYAIDNSGYSPESQEIILGEIKLLGKFVDLNNLNLRVEEVKSIGDEIKELILPEPFDSNDFFY